MSPAEEHKARFEALFNYATLPFYWRWYEEERGRPNYAYTETVIEWCKERGIRMKAHPVLWDAISGKPAWNGDRMPPPELQRARIFDLLGRFGDAIEFWEIVNEPAHCKGVAIDEPYRWARQARPDACLIVNDYQVMADGCPPFYELLKAAVRAGVPFDGIGIQAHEPPHLWFPMDRTWEILDRYAELGKGLHITEFTPTSDGERVVGMVDRGVWDEEKQAEFAEKFYRVCFGHPAVVAITWWDLSDATSWRKNGGLVDAEMRPKPAYLRLRRLIREEWMTRISGRTDETGRFAFRGFFGRYRVTVMSGSAAATREVNLEKGDSRGARVEWVVDLPAQQPERNGTASLERARRPTVKTAPR
ncbi:endo-1,4-beta-xylanase [bacterium]|nr:endo-1,4-beta-xylanase [bacterium]